MKSLISFKSTLVAAALVGIAFAAQAQTEVVYDNSSDPILGTFAPSDKSLEFGDQIVLDGSSRIVTEFRLEYYSSEAAGDATVRFRSNSGPNLEPADILFESATIPLQANFNTINIEGIGVPISGDTFTFTIEFDVAGTQDVGLILRNPPSVGSSFDDVWVNTQLSNGAWNLVHVILVFLWRAVRVQRLLVPHVLHASRFVHLIVCLHALT
ncbi:MAG: hypothetical protein ACO3VS_06350, partial [Limisphaerales bacterium]